jgi:hypothetical protein
MNQDTTYQNHIIRIQPHHDRCSEYSFVIIDSEGNEIKHVNTGGDTWEKALAKAKGMIDLEILLQEQ